MKDEFAKSKVNNKDFEKQVKTKFKKIRKFKCIHKYLFIKF